MKAAATSLLIAGCVSVGLSFGWNRTDSLRGITPTEASSEDVTVAHQELINPTAQELQQQEAAQARIAAQAESQQKAATNRGLAQRVLRYGGCLLALVGLGLLWPTRTT